MSNSLLIRAWLACLCCHLKRKQTECVSVCVCARICVCVRMCVCAYVYVCANVWEGCLVSGRKDDSRRGVECKALIKLLIFQHKSEVPPCLIPSSITTVLEVTKAVGERNFPVYALR